MNKPKKKEAHVANTKYGTGDYYGTGLKAKVGKIRDSYLNQSTTSKGLKKPPRSLA